MQKKPREFNQNGKTEGFYKQINEKFIALLIPLSFKAESNFIELKQVPSIDKTTFSIYENEYQEMLKINDIIQRLIVIDRKTFRNNRVHDGWGILFDYLHPRWESKKLPFIGVVPA
ncbi:hypothetical protein [Paenibacillus ferrarius]|uniref:hypothetical protein n=1 Tax=Paenibacillus ferrarius TaxID=1469647 RepID=UPI00117C011A|nr:hypothetical protein [Paenibacillus ferrarius]